VTTKSDDLLDIAELDPDLILVKPETAKPPKKRKRNVEWGGALIGLLAGVCGLLAGRLGQIWVAFDVFAQFTAQFLFLTGAFVVATFMPKRKAFIGLVLSALFCLGYGLWAQSTVGPPQGGPWTLNPGERAIRAAHFNMFFRNNDFDAIEAEIRRLDADVITLIEFTEEKQALMPRLKSLYPYQVECAAVWNCHLAIFSKFPMTKIEAKSRWLGPPFIAARMEGPLQGLSVYGVHTTRFPHSRAQMTQVNAFVKHLEAASGKLLVMGDFNATPYSRVTTTLERGLGMNRLTRLPTWPSTIEVPQLAIDHVFASQGIRVLAPQQIGKAAGSDHYPIVMTLGVDLQ
jgi:endonuclease/exonuclease/phosphatase (EEP) superfamily protein YafD